MSDLLKHRNLQAVAKELNEKFELKFKTINTREAIISHILDTIGNATEEQQEALSPEAVDVYNALLAVPPVDEVNVVKEVSEDTEDACQAYGVAYDGGDPECKACDQAEECQEKTMKTAAAKSVAKKEKPVKEVKEKAPKAEVVKSRYGHKVGSMSAAIDDMLWVGTSKADMVSSLMEQFNKNEAAVNSKIKGHLAWLKKQNIVEVSEADGVYKTPVESI